ncbi:MAG: radical SAM protein [Clostridia bacterium]|nr:radical SAM protein [Clostridia bacterium]
MAGSVKNANVSIFVPHFGCPQQCTFCNQRSITGAQGDVIENARQSIETARRTLGDKSKNAEIAFFGGSFTAIDREFMLTLLSLAYEYVRRGEFRGIRISTRPDGITHEILDILGRYGVTSIELGAQSMDDGVLELNRRGHDSRCVETASELIRSNGFELGLQMMTGMYGSDDEKDILTAQKIIALRPDTVRIYPTVVIKGTPLAELYRRGEYTPPILDGAVTLCAKLLMMFENQGIRVIRLGLHSGGDVEGSFVAGVYHPALRELCESRIYLKNATELLKGEAVGKKALLVALGCTSKMVGQRRANLGLLRELGFDCTVKEKDGLCKYEVEIGEAE